MHHNKKMYIELLLLCFLCVNTAKPGTGVYFKMADEGRFIGHDHNNNELKLVDASLAVPFTLNDTDNAAEKKLMTMDRKGAFTEEGWWGLRKWFEVSTPDRGDRQGINVVYSGPGVYILMRDGSCLSEVSGLLRKVYCTQPEINKFRMCKNIKCVGGKNDRVVHDIEKIKAMLMNFVHSPAHQSPPSYVAAPKTISVDPALKESEDYTPTIYRKRKRPRVRTYPVERIIPEQVRSEGNTQYDIKPITRRITVNNGHQHQHNNGDYVLETYDKPSDDSYEIDSHEQEYSSSSMNSESGFSEEFSDF